jgi:hypothetical protein
MTAAAQGKTPSERYLGSLARKAFLSLWSHPNVYTDENKKPGKGVGTELCDLLVVFGNDVLIFSDKHVEFKVTGNLTVDWKRWYRRAIHRSVRQLRGAKSWLKRFPDRLFLDPECSKPFPIQFPKLEVARFHLIAVTRGSYEACEAFFGGKSLGSLRINTGLKGDEDPFTIGLVDGPKSIIHIFDEFTVDLLMRELDAVSDFTAYLRAKERFLTRDMVISVPGEEQLLAIYLTKLNEQQEHDIVIPQLEKAESPPNFLALDESFWEPLPREEPYIAKKRADEISYSWDNLVNRFIDYGDPSVLSNISMPQVEPDVEPALRVMASESRVRRRLLGRALIDFLGKAPRDKAFARLVHSSTHPEVAYVFLAEPYKDNFSDYDDYRRYRLARIAAYCHVAPLRAAQAKEIIGIAFDSPGHGGSSEDLFGYSFEEFTEEMRGEALRLQQELKILSPENIKQQSGSEDEFPREALEARSQRKRQEKLEALAIEILGRPALNRAERRRIEQEGRKRKI